MNDSMSILLATSLLALGGLGLYMFKSSNQEDMADDQDNSHSFFGGMWGNDDNEEEEDYEEDFPVDERPARKRVTSKTQRNRKSTGTSKRRYY